MDEKKPNLNTAMNDLNHIRSVLDRTETAFPALAPSFRRVGLVWLAAALVSFLVTGPDILCFLWPVFDFDVFGGADLYVYYAAQAVLLVYPLVQCALWQREKSVRNFSGLARKLLTLWQVLLVLSMSLALLSAAGQDLFSNGSGFVENWDGFMSSLSFTWILPVIFPAIPLLVTSILMEDRPLRWVGGVVFLIGVVYGVFVVAGAAGFNIVEFSLGLYLAQIALSLLREFLSPIALLLLAWRLKKVPEGA